MSRAADVIGFIDLHDRIYGNFRWITEMPNRAFRANLKRWPKDKRPALTAERKTAFTGNAPDPCKYWMASCAAAKLEIPDDFFGEADHCTGPMTRLEVLPDLERPGKWKIKGVAPLVEPASA